MVMKKRRKTQIVAGQVTNREGTHSKKTCLRNNPHLQQRNIQAAKPCADLCIALQIIHLCSYLQTADYTEKEEEEPP